MSGGRAGWLCALLALAGCQDPLTEVVVVIDSDLQVPGDVDSVQFRVDDTQFFDNLERFPASIGVVSQGTRTAFSFHVTLGRVYPPQNPVISRSATGIRFVEGETMMLVVKLPAACACVGTNCPNPGAFPDCDNLVSPPLEPFDPAVAPVSQGGSPGSSGMVPVGPL
jgi:hypothetical protein